MQSYGNCFPSKYRKSNGFTYCITMTNSDKVAFPICIIFFVNKANDGGPPTCITSLQLCNSNYDVIVINENSPKLIGELLNISPTSGL